MTSPIVPPCFFSEEGISQQCTIPRIPCPFFFFFPLLIFMSTHFCIQETVFLLSVPPGKAGSVQLTTSYGDAFCLHLCRRRTHIGPAAGRLTVHRFGQLCGLSRPLYFVMELDKHTDSRGVLYAHIALNLVLYSNLLARSEPPFGFPGLAGSSHIITSSKASSPISHHLLPDAVLCTGNAILQQ